MNRIRPPAVAGSFYPAEIEDLRRGLEKCFVSSPLGPQGAQPALQSLIGGMVPHAGYTYSGPCAAHFFACLEHCVKRVVVLGVNHRVTGHKAALSASDFWETPLGKVRVDHELAESLQKRVSFLKHDELAHSREHSIEVQLPLLQRALTDFHFLPISLSQLSAWECAELGHGLAEVCSEQSVILASSDLSHYRSPEETEMLDRMVLEQVLARDPQALLEIVEEQNISMCGVVPTAVALFAINGLGASKARLLKHCHSGDAVPMPEVVGYASVAFEI